MNRFCVYGHYTNNSHELFYIGKGTLSRAYSKKNRNLYWQRVAKKYGYYVEIFIKNLPEDTAYIQEILGIKEFSPRCNFTKGGGGPSGFKQSRETINRRIYPSGIHCRIGKKHSEETKQKISITKKTAGIVTKAYPVICIKSKKTWKTIKDCAKELGVKRTTLNAKLVGQCPNTTTIRYLKDTL